MPEFVTLHHRFLSLPSSCFDRVKCHSDQTKLNKFEVCHELEFKKQKIRQFHFHHFHSLELLDVSINENRRKKYIQKQKIDFVCDLQRTKFIHFNGRCHFIVLNEHENVNNLRTMKHRRGREHERAKMSSTINCYFAFSMQSTLWEGTNSHSHTHKLWQRQWAPKCVNLTCCVVRFFAHFIFLCIISLDVEHVAYKRCLEFRQCFKMSMWRTSPIFYFSFIRCECAPEHWVRSNESHFFLVSMCTPKRREEITI